MTHLILATRNRHKMQEIEAILGPARFLVLTLCDVPGVPALREDAATFAGNAEAKARQLATWLSATDSPATAVGPAFVLADDSGLEVDALDGAPGVHSARFAGLDTGGAGNSADADNNAKLLRLLAGVPEERRTARFRCVMALVPLRTPMPPGETVLFEGSCEGRIAFQPAGGGGFGYDPLFFPIGFSRSFAELGPEVKNTLSHRAKALAKLRDWLAASADAALPGSRHSG